MKRVSLASQRGAEPVAEHEMRPAAGRPAPSRSTASSGNRSGWRCRSACGSSSSSSASAAWNGRYSRSMRSKARADRQPLAIDLLGVGDDPRDGAEPADHPRRLACWRNPAAAVEQLRIELVGLAVDVEIGARKARRDQRRAERPRPARTARRRSSPRTCAACAGRAGRRRGTPWGRCGPECGEQNTNGRELLVGPQHVVTAASARRIGVRVHAGVMHRSRVEAADSVPMRAERLDGSPDCGETATSAPSCTNASQCAVHRPCPVP